MTPSTIRDAFDLALRHHRAGRLQEAEQLYRQILAQQPAHVDAIHFLGLIAQQLGRNEDSVELIRRAISLKPDYAEAHYNLGVGLRKLGQLNSAMAAFRQAISLRPNYAEAHYNLGKAHSVKCQLDEAIAAYRQAVRFNPGSSEACNNLGVALKDIGQLDEAIAAFRQAGVVEPGYSEAHSNLVYLLNYHPNYDAQGILEEHRTWNRRHAEPLAGLIRSLPNVRDPERRLRIGYVSPDFREHPVGRFFTPLMDHHDRGRFEIFCYSNACTPDSMTERFQSRADAWRNIFGMTDEAAAEAVRQDKIDILVDLAGHTANNRLLIFARKPVPVQVTYLGYPATTGLGAIDYRLTDALADPPGLADAHCSERLIRLSHSAWCYQPAPDAPPVNALPALRDDRITFGCFANFAKVNEPLLRLWANVLRRAPKSRLLLKAMALQCKSVRQQIHERMLQEGISPDRLELLSLVRAEDHLAQHHQVDVALDTYPYHGTTTTCEALWMGVPVVTLAGQSHASRVGVSLLTNVGLTEMIASTPEEYVRIAIDLANDLPRLSEIRASLRQRMSESPLMDGPGFARRVEAAYRQMWRK